MKRLLSMIISVFMCIGFLQPVFADEANSEVVEKLMLTVKEKLQISDDEFVFSTYYQSRRENESRYDLNWESRDENNSSSIGVEIGENGTIYRFNFYDSTKEYGQIKYPVHTEGEALSAAKKFFEVVDKAKSQEVMDEEITYASYDNLYLYSAVRKHNDLPVFDNRVTIQVDADSLKVTSYYINWDEQLTFTDGSIIEFDSAVKAYREKLGYELFYQVVAEEYKDEIKAVYRPKYDEALYIDALSGEAVSLSQFYELSAGGSSATMNVKEEAAADTALRLSPEEQAMVDEIAGMLSKEKAESIARGVSEFEITKDYNVTSFSIHKDSHGKYVGRLSFNLEKEDEYGYRNVMLDLKSGEIIAYNGYSNQEDEKSDKKAELTNEEARNIAEKFLKKYYADRFAKTVEKSVFEPNGGSISYLRSENGVKIYNNGLTVHVNEATKKIGSFSLEWTEAEFPDMSGLAGLDKVYEKLLDTDNFRCGYLITYDGESKPEAQPVYRLMDEPVLNALTLSELDWKLRPIESEEKPTYSDLGNHYAKEAAEKLLVMDIYYPSDELKPDDAVKQKEYLELISKVVFNRTTVGDENEFYNYMIRRGVLDKEDIRPDAAISRIDGIRYLLNALGYKEFAHIPGIFNCPFKDVKEEDRGYGAIAAGIKLVHSEADTFYAENNLKRGDSLIIIYNYLSR